MPTENTIPVIRIPNVQDGLDLRDMLYLEGVTSEQRAASAVSKGWTLMVGSNGNPRRIGDCAFVKEDREMVFASFLFALRPKPGSGGLIDEFLALWCNTHRVHEFISTTSQMTTGLANMSWSACRKIPVRYPSDPAEQARIAETLKAADDHIRALEDQIRKAERVKNSLVEQGTTLGLDANARKRTLSRYRHAFVCNANWDLVELRQLKPQIDYGTNQASNDQRIGVPVIAIPQVLASRFALSDLPFADVSEQERMSLSLQPQDVLLVRTNGNPSYIGRSTVIPEGVLMTLTVFASYLIRVRVNEKCMRGAFLNYVLQSQTGRRQSNCLANTSAGNFNLGARSLSKLSCPCPRPKNRTRLYRRSTLRMTWCCRYRIRCGLPAA